MKKTITYLLLGLSLLSCTLNEARIPQREVMRVKAVVQDKIEIDTKSVLSESDSYANSINSLTLAFYDEAAGKLMATVYSSSGDIDIELDRSRTYHIFALANMGDLTGSMPTDMGDLKGFRYEIQSYSALRSSGLPMVYEGVSPWKAVLPVSLRRLMAKLVITVDTSELNAHGAGSGAFSNDLISVSRIARAVYPFMDGGSRALNADDLFSGSDIEYDTFSYPSEAKSNELILYVPENKQGTLLDGNTDQSEKSDDNTSLTGQEFSTYVELKGEKIGITDGVYGDFIYRFYPGKDNVTNFDLEGNSLYNISLHLTWDGLYTTSGWMVEKSNFSDKRKLMVSYYPDKGYTTSFGTTFALGSTRVPLYIYYSPQGKAYESEADGGQPHHLSSGWVFHPYDESYSAEAGKNDTPLANTAEYSGANVITGFVNHGAYRTEHYLTIPTTATPIGGKGYRIRYSTPDGRKAASFSIYITASKTISVSPSELYFDFFEYGYETRRTVTIGFGGTIKPCNVEASSSDESLMTVGPIDPVTGEFEVYWNNTNTSSSTRSAKVVLRSECCNYTQYLTVYQYAPKGLVIEGEEEGGDIEIEY